MEGIEIETQSGLATSFLEMIISPRRIRRHAVAETSK